MRIISLLAACLSVMLVAACSSSSDSNPPPVASSSSSSASQSSSSSSSGPIASGDCGADAPDSLPAEINTLPSVKCIVVDQFGYLPDAQKVAVVRNPEQGFDADLSFSPGATYSVVDTQTNQTVFSGAPIAWNNGALHEVSGDRAWWFDFSSLTTPGTYVVVDDNNRVRSPEFRIDANVYREVLVQAVRTFFYQRAGFAKETPFAEPGWADGASHVGAGQDTQARLWNATGNASTQRDLSGGWYDAGDYNKYTNWHADYLIAMLHAYQENPSAWTDDFNIPESGNGIPDLIDEIIWGMDWLIKMQEGDGSVLSVMGLSHHQDANGTIGASPPSSATGPSTYGPATTAATLTSAAAFALGTKILSEFEEFGAYADDLLARAEKAWSWAEDNPSVTFYNSGNVAAGEQEVDDYGRFIKRLMAAIYLYEVTGKSEYRAFVEDQYQNVNMMQWQFVFVFQAEIQHAMLYFSALDGVTPAVANAIRSVYQNALTNGEDHWPAINSSQDAYRAHLQTYTWGSNRSKAQHGSIFYDQYTFNAGSPGLEQTRNVALRYINYLHGVNPLGKVYLSNMGGHGAEDSVDSFYHSWFSSGSPHWDSVSASNFGPAPGFLVGGPNPSYSWDGCCPDNCGSSSNNAMCGMAPLSPPAGQPTTKSYLDFNDSWPLNSWSVTENHNAYQVAYIRLLSKFVQ